MVGVEPDYLAVIALRGGPFQAISIRLTTTSLLLIDAFDIWLAGRHSDNGTIAGG